MEFDKCRRSTRLAALQLAHNVYNEEVAMMTREQVERGLAILNRNDFRSTPLQLLIQKDDHVVVRCGKGFKRIGLKVYDDPIKQPICSECGGKGKLSLSAYRSRSTSEYDGLITNGWGMSTSDHKKTCSEYKRMVECMRIVNGIFAGV